MRCTRTRELKRYVLIHLHRILWKYQPTFQALEKGIFAEEIIPIELRGKTVSVDDTIRKGVTLESLAGLKSAFEWGDRRSTAGNSAGVGDGAALCILTTRKRAEAEGFEILGKYVASTFVGVEPRYMGISPIAAVPKILEQTGLTKEDIDIFEVSSIRTETKTCRCSGEAD